MSIILDALRKADAQRKRGAVPDIHTAPSLEPARPERAGPPWLGIALVVALLLVAAGLWTQGPWSGARVESARVNDAAMSAPPVRSVVPVAPMAAANTPGSAGSMAAAPQPRAGAAGGTAAPPQAAMPPVGQSAPASQAVPTAAAAPAAPVERIYALNELPDNVRRELPAFNVTGAMHSDLRADRVLIVSGRLLREGDELVAGCVLEEIQPRSALLAYRGYRIRLTW